MIYADYSVMVFVGVATEVETVKKALAEAEKKAAKEQAPVKNTRPGLMRSSRSSRTPLRNANPWSATLRIKRPNSPRLARVHNRPEPKPKAPSEKSRRPKRSRRVRLLLCKASM